MTSKILVAGATGNVGAHVVRELAARGLPTRAFVRDPARARERFGTAGAAVETVVGDFQNAPSIGRALADVDMVFLASGNAPTQLEHEAAMIDAAAAAGVRRIVKLSAIGAEAGSMVAFWDAHGRLEERLLASRVPSVVLRPAFYMTNFLAAAESARRHATIFAPAVGARIAMIDPRDVAAAAVAALTSDRVGGATYELTGSESVDYDRVAEEISAAAGTRVRFVGVPDDLAREGMVAAGMPPWFAENMIKLFGRLRAGAYDRTTGDLLRLTGRAPRTLGDFVRDHADAFRAGPAASAVRLVG